MDARTLQVGFIGLSPGSGGRMARALIHDAWQVTISRDDPSGLDAMAGARVTVVDSIADLARASDVIIYRDMAPVDVFDDASDKVADEVVETLLANVRPLTVVVNARARGRAADARLKAERARESDIHLVDAMTAAPGAPGEKPWRGLLVGADRETYDRIRPVLVTLADTAPYVGGPGAGIVMKYFTSLVFNANLMVIAGMLEFGEKLGLDRDGMINVVQAGSADSYALGNLVRHEIESTCPTLEQLIAMFEARNANMAAEARALGIAPSLLEEWGALGLDMLPTAVRRIADYQT